MSPRPERLSFDDAGITRAAGLLREGGLVALPTETVYGLAVDARNAKAVARVFEAKGRPTFNPLIVHVAELDQAEDIAEMSDAAAELAQSFWPGPLTLVLPLRPNMAIAPLTNAGLATVAIRLPAHPAMHAVLRSFGGLVAAPSANRSGQLSPTTAEHVVAGLGDRIAAVLDAGPTQVGIESTILAPGPDGTRLLREGGVPRESIETITGPLITDTAPAAVEAPGQLAHHYAPDAPLQLGGAAAPGAITVGFGPGDSDLNLSPDGDLVEAAARLFAVLHEADRLAETRSAPSIHIRPVPETGLGRAINDRLRRAAAPRG